MKRDKFFVQTLSCGKVTKQNIKKNFSEVKIVRSKAKMPSKFVRRNGAVPAKCVDRFEGEDIYSITEDLRNAV